MSYKRLSRDIFLRRPVVFCSKDQRNVLVGGVDKSSTEIINQVAEELEVTRAVHRTQRGPRVPKSVHLFCEVKPQFGVHQFVERSKKAKRPSK
jgi:REP element-mobilizing transposase RayT